jgi:hypothetical protein
MSRAYFDEVNGEQPGGHANRMCNHLDMTIETNASRAGKEQSNKVFWFFFSKKNKKKHFFLKKEAKTFVIAHLGIAAGLGWTNGLKTGLYAATGDSIQHCCGVRH